jgi:nucleoside-diphosphate-sugar epimerase
MGFEHVIPEFCRKMNRAAALRTDAPIPFSIQGTGEETRSFCYITDCVFQLRLLLEGAERLGIYNIGTMDERSIADVAHAVAKCYGREIKLIPGTLPKGSPPRRLPDMSKLERMGYMPLIPFHIGVEKTVEWYQRHG